MVVQESFLNCHHVSQVDRVPSVWNMIETVFNDCLKFYTNCCATLATELLGEFSDKRREHPTSISHRTPIWCLDMYLVAITYLTYKEKGENDLCFVSPMAPELHGCFLFHNFAEKQDPTFLHGQSFPKSNTICKCP